MGGHFLNGSFANLVSNYPWNWNIFTKKFEGHFKQSSRMSWIKNIIIYLHELKVAFLNEFQDGHLKWGLYYAEPHLHIFIHSFRSCKHFIYRTACEIFINKLLISNLMYLLKNIIDCFCSTSKVPTFLIFLNIYLMLRSNWLFQRFIKISCNTSSERWDVVSGTNYTYIIVHRKEEYIFSICVEPIKKLHRSCHVSMKHAIVNYVDIVG